MTAKSKHLLLFLILHRVRLSGSKTDQLHTIITESGAQIERDYAQLRCVAFHKTQAKEKKNETIPHARLRTADASRPVLEKYRLESSLQNGFQICGGTVKRRADDITLSWKKKGSSLQTRRRRTKGGSPESQ